ncbi:unnamed protein product [Amoebophrya sp. A120]|nr:unnamed protein product [Amoebophrya sp. A120]|eukprot:GSA120T00020148001.1
MASVLLSTPSAAPRAAVARTRGPIFAAAPLQHAKLVPRQAWQRQTSTTTSSCSSRTRHFATDSTKIYRSGKNNIFFNFAAETSLCNQPLKNVLFQWRNETVVTIGRHQNPWTECRLAELEKDGVELVRRVSGGGAVLQDLGCLTFSLIANTADYQNTADSPATNALAAFTEKNFKLVIKALERSGIPDCARSGRNDIVYKNEFKISGSAFKTMNNSAQVPKLLHHGTLLFDTDFTSLGRYLTPAKQKLQAKGIQSVKSRVINLKEINPALTLEELMANFEAVFLEEYNHSPTEPETLTPDSSMLAADPVFADVQKRMSDWDFRFGQTPQFSHTMGPHRLHKSEDADAVWGMFECHLEVDNGVIQDGVVFSDCLLPDAVTKVNAILKNCKTQTGKINYVAEELKKALVEEGNNAGYVGDEKKLVSDFADWVGTQMKE